MKENDKAKQEAKNTVQIFLSIVGDINKAKSCGIEFAKGMIKITPMYVGNLNPKWLHWNRVKELIEKMQ